MCQASDENKRVEAQAASNSMTQINQQDVDDMVTVQYLLGSSNSRSVATLFHLTWLAAFIMSYLAGCLQHVLSVWLPLTCLTWLAAFIMSYLAGCLHYVLPGWLPPSCLTWLAGLIMSYLAGCLHHVLHDCVPPSCLTWLSFRLT